MRREAEGLNTGVSRLPRVAPLIAALLPVVACAADLQAAAELGVGRSDNIARTSGNEQAETISEAGLELAFAQSSRRLDANIASDLSYFHYQGGLYPSELVGNATGQAVVSLVQDRVWWTASDNFGQTQRDLFTAVTPANRENINYFSTGPDLIVRFGITNDVQLGGRYTRVDYETTPLDSNRYSGTLALAHHFSDASFASLNGRHEHVDYSTDSVAGADFDNTAIYAALSGSGAHTHLVVNAGANQIERAGAKENGALVFINLSRDLSARSTIAVDAGQELTDPGSVFGSTTVDTNVTLNTQALTNTSNPFQHRYVDARWDVTGRRTRLGASVTFSHESYEANTLLDRQRIVGEVHVSRDFGSRLTVRLLGNYAKDDFLNTLGDSDEIDAILGAVWRVSRQLRLDLSMESYDRNGDVVSGSFSERRYWLRLRYGDASVSGVGAFRNPGSGRPVRTSP